MTRCDVLKLLPTFCPNYVKNGQPYYSRPIDHAILIYSFHMKRSYYFAKLIMKLAEVILAKADKIVNDTSVIQIDDTIYFNFDAFVFSCKGVLESNLYKRLSDNIDKQLKPDFDNFAAKAKAAFIDPLLTILRNEIIHVNYGGSGGYFNTALIETNSDGKNIRIYSNFRRNDIPVDLLELFSEVLTNMDSISEGMTKFISKDIYLRFGTPSSTKFISDNGKIIIPELTGIA